MDIKEQMIEAYERGETSYEGAYDYVRDRLADRADRERKESRENFHDTRADDFARPYLNDEDIKDEDASS